VAFLGNSGATTNVEMGSGAAVATNKVWSGANAVRLWGATNGAVNPAVVLGNVDISGYTNVTLTIPFAAAGPDSGDDLYVAVSYDGGTTWAPSAFGTQIADGFSGLSLDYNVTHSVDRQPQGTPYVLAVPDVQTQIMVRVAFSNATGSPNASDFYYLDEIQLKGDEGTAPPVSSALSVTISPAGAVSAGAQWRVDGGAWRASGAVATGLTAGAHTVSFSAVAGWTAPAAIATATTNGTTNAVAATYVEDTGPVSVEILNEPFDTAPTAPSGWTFNGVDSYTTASYAGQAVPSVKFDTNGDSILSPTFLGATNVQFWMRAVTAAGVGTFVIEQQIGGSWTTVGVITNPSNTGTTYSLALSESATQIRFTWNKTTSNIALDDVRVTGVEADPDLDSDGDGMPDAYEATYFNGATNGLPGADDDDDGVSNHAEYIAGTNPRTNTSVLAVASLTPQAGAVTNLVFRWPSVTGRVYSILRASNATGDYARLVTGIAANAPTNTYTNAAPAGAGTYFYGIGVQLAP
jgi:hypothetical protein